MARTPAGPSPGAIIGDIDRSYERWRQSSYRDWPVEQLKALGGAYTSPAAVDLFGMRKSGRPRISGIGPALVSMAALSGNKDAQAIAKSQGLFGENYGMEQFERQHGFVTVAKAATVGVPTYRNGQVLLNERRKTALAEGSGQTGGYLIPPQFMQELLTIAAEDGFIEPRAKVVPMNSRTAEWPMLDITTVQASGTSPYFGGILAQWQPEAATINETEPAFKQSVWTAWDLVLYSVSSNQLLADNGIGLDALLTQLFGQAITWYKEFAYLQGKGAGSSMPLGILNAPATISQGRLQSSRFLYQDAATMLAHLQVRSWDDAAWIMHQSVLPQLLMMVDGGWGNAASPSSSFPAGNRLVWVNPTMTTDRGPAASKLPNAFLNGLPVFFTEKLPQLGTKGDVMLVDWSRYVIGMRLDMQIDVSPHYLFRNNQLAWRVIARCDGKPWLNNAITDQAGWTISPFVVLN
jgi:HK97 family phage major capsid protein